MNENVLCSRERTVSLLECYESLLTEKQREVMDDYYRYDLSLGEIAENRSISRAGVHDTLQKSNEKLEEFECKLLLLKKKEALCDEIKSIEDEKDDDVKLSRYRALGKELTHGI